MAKLPNLTKLTLQILYFILSLVFFPIFVIICIPFFTLRLFVKVLAKFFGGRKLVRISDSTDSLFTSIEAQIYTYPEEVIPILLTLQGEFNLDEIKERFQNCVLNTKSRNGKLNFSRLLQHPVQWLGYTFYEWDENFKLADHLRVISNSGFTSPEEFVAAHVCDPFRESCSLWDITFLQEFEPQKTLILFRFHHSLCDGYGILKVLHAFTGADFPAESENNNQNNKEKRHKSPPRSWTQNFTNEIGSIVSIPYNYVESVKGLNLGKYFPKRYEEYRTKPFKCLYSMTSKIPLKDFKFAAKKLNVGFSVIVHSALSLAISRQFERDRSLRGQLNPEYSTYVSFTYVLPRHPEDRLRNLFGIGNVQLELSDSDKINILDLLEKSKLHWESARDKNLNIFLRCIITIIGSLPNCLSRKILSNGTKNIVISNMPGPKEPTLMSNSKFTDMMFWITPKLPMSLSIFSYMGNIRLGVSAQESFIGSRQALKDLIVQIEEEIQNIFELARIEEISGLEAMNLDGTKEKEFTLV